MENSYTAIVDNNTGSAIGSAMITARNSEENIDQYLTNH